MWATHSLTTHTLKVDRALLQSTVRDRLAHKAREDAARKRSSLSNNNNGFGGSAGSGGSGGSVGTQGALARLRNSLSMRRSGAIAGGVAGVSGGGGVGGSMPAQAVSDDKRWQQLQEAQSV